MPVCLHSVHLYPPYRLTQDHRKAFLFLLDVYIALRTVLISYGFLIRGPLTIIINFGPGSGSYLDILWRTETKYIVKQVNMIKTVPVPIGYNIDDFFKNYFNL
jgi:hypothetical protein